MPDSKRDDTLRTVIVSRISNTGTLAISVLALLAILLTLVEQRLHQFQTEIDEASRVRTRTAKRMQIASRSLTSVRSVFFQHIHVPKTGKNKSTSVPSLLPLTPDDYANFHRIFRPSFLDLKPEEQRPAFDAGEKALREQLPQAVQSTFVPPPGKPKEEEPFGQWRREQLGLGLAALEEYRNTVEMITRERTSVAANAARIRSVQEKTESIPTPFGSFQINARLALLGLAFAAFLSYLYFASASRAIVRLGGELARGRDDEAIDAVAVPSPSWIYAAEPRVRRLLSWNDDDEPVHRVATAALHLTWITLGVVAAVEAWRKSAARLLVFDPHGLSYVFLALLALGAVTFFVSTFSLEVADVSRDLAGSLASRRAALTLFLAAALGGVVILLTRHHRKSRRLRKRMAARMNAPGEYQIVINTKTGVAHHAEVCSHHLPKKERWGVPSAKAPLHRRWEAAVLYGIVIEKEKSMRGQIPELGTMPQQKMTLQELLSFSEQREKEWIQGRIAELIPLLEKAIQFAPWSYHLHHKLIRLYGRQQQYDKIPEFLNEAKARAEAALKQPPASKAALKAIQKAHQQFTGLLRTVEQRAEAAKHPRTAGARE